MLLHYQLFTKKKKQLERPSVQVSKCPSEIHHSESQLASQVENTDGIPQPSENRPDIRHPRLNCTPPV